MIDQIETLQELDATEPILDIPTRRRQEADTALMLYGRGLLAMSEAGLVQARRLLAGSTAVTAQFQV